jgi:IPT/TIG domain
MSRIGLFFTYSSRTFATVLGASSMLVVGCGGGGVGIPGGGGSTPSNVPTLSGVAPSTALVGASAITIIASGSNFTDGVTIQWNGTALATACVETNVTIQVACTSATELTASVPASDFTTAGSAKVTLLNPSPGGGTSGSLNFTIATSPAAKNWARAVAGITVPWDEVWDSVHGKLYVSTATQDPAYPNMLIPIDPVAGTAGAAVTAGNNPNFLDISSDSSYLWAGLEGSNSVARFLLPGLTSDISFQVPLDSVGRPQQAVSMQAAPVSPHTLAVVAGCNCSPAGDGVYVYDDATVRPTSVPGFMSSGPTIDWIQWGKDDSTLYATQTTIEGGGGILPLQVSSSGVSWNGTGGGLTAALIDYDRQNGLAYSRDGQFGVGGVYDPVLNTEVGQFDVPGPDTTCTADSTLNRYYCVAVSNEGGADVYAVELWVFDLNTYALLDRVYFGTLQGESGASQPNSTISGAPRRLVRWGNAGLALITSSGAEYGIPVSESPYGAGGVFLIDGAAVNPSVAPDVASGSSPSSFAWLSSISPQAATAGSGGVTVTIDGTGFSPDSTACWNCSVLQFQFLPTSYIGPTQLSVTIPASQLATAGPLAISVFDQSANLFSTNALTFTASPASGSTQVTALNLAGLAMAWDVNSQLIYVGTADYDGGYPNSIVGVNGESGTIMTSRSVSPDPDILSDGAGGQFLYATFATTTNMTQFALPGLNPTVTWRLQDPKYGNTFLAGDMKAAPVSPHTTAVTLFSYGSTPTAQGGVAIFDDGVERPVGLPGWLEGQTVSAIYDVLAWGDTDSILASAENDNNSGLQPLYALGVSASGVSYVGQNASFNNEYNEIHSDFGTGLVYSDDGNVGDPTTAAIVGTYNASGLVAPDSSLDRVFILGQTAAQANTNSFTIQSFDEKAYTLVSSITLDNLAGSPFQLVRWGTSGLAVLTSGGVPGVLENSNGMLYLVNDSTFVSNAQLAAANNARLAAPAEVIKPELVQQRWKRLSKKEILNMAHHRTTTQ